MVGMVILVRFNFGKKSDDDHTYDYLCEVKNNPLFCAGCVLDPAGWRAGNEGHDLD